MAALSWVRLAPPRAARCCGRERGPCRVRVTGLERERAQPEAYEVMTLQEAGRPLLSGPPTIRPALGSAPKVQSARGTLWALSHSHAPGMSPAHLVTRSGARDYTPGWSGHLPWQIRSQPVQCESSFAQGSLPRALPHRGLWRSTGGFVILPHRHAHLNKVSE